MATELFNANLASTNVLAGGTDAPPSGTSETWTVASSAAFPVAVTGTSEFHVADPALNTEVIAVTNVNGNTWTVTRGAENTTPLAHAAGFNVYQVVTTGFLGSLSQSSGTKSLVLILPSGDGSGITDVATLNAAILAANTAGGGIVQGQPGGTFYLDAPLVLRSNVTLNMTECVINEVANANCNMLSNAAVTPLATGTGSMTSGGNTLTTTLVYSAAAGQSVYVAGGSNGGSNVLCGLVGSINLGAGTLTVVDFYGNALNAAANVTGGAVNLYNRDTSIQVAGGTWNRGNNGFETGGFSPLCCTTNLKRIDGLYVHDATFTCTGTNRGYNVAYGDCSNFHFSDITINAPATVPNTDGINGHGPLAFGKIENIFGTCGDDFTSLNGLDTGLGAIPVDTTGSISDVEVTGLFPNGNLGAALSILTVNTSAQVSRITARGIHGSSYSNAILIGPLPGYQPAGSSWVDEILIEDVDNEGGGGIVVIFATYAGGQITLRNLSWTGNSYTGNGTSGVYVDSGTTLGSLVIDGLEIATTSTTTIGVQVAGTVTDLTVRGLRIPNSSVVMSTGGVVVIQGTVTTLAVENAHLNMAGSVSETAVVYNNGTVGVLHAHDIYLTGSYALFLATSGSAAAMQALMSDVTLNAARYFINCESTIDARIAGLNVQSLVDGNIIWLGASTSHMTLQVSGLLNPGATALFSAAGGAPTPTYTILDNEKITTSPGAMTFNSPVTIDVSSGNALVASTDGSTTSAGAFVVEPSSHVFGLWSTDSAKLVGISMETPGPAGTVTLGGFWTGLAVGGLSNGGTSPIFGVLNSAQSGHGIGGAAFTVEDSNQVYTYNNTLDDGSGNLTAAGAVSTTGLTGATAASRYVGATTGGPPASGVFSAGDFISDQGGLMWVCTSGGTPGTWTFSETTIPSFPQTYNVTAATNILAGPTITPLAGSLWKFNVWGALTTTVDTQTVNFSTYCGGNGLLTVSGLNPNSGSSISGAACRFQGSVLFSASTAATCEAQTDLDYYFANFSQQGSSTVAPPGQLKVNYSASSTAVTFTVNGGYWQRIH